uniref:PDZ domain-containing protein n=1 Tax=Strongyloides stercoralis TaxID=6248 RepID=A0AAF5CZA4_STRER
DILPEGEDVEINISGRHLILQLSNKKDHKKKKTKKIHVKLKKKPLRNIQMHDSTDTKSESSLVEEDLEGKRRHLIESIQNWNENRLELFAISMPEDSSNEIYGVMRFYFRDIGEKVFSKCIRISSTATTETVIEALIEKFRPDMKMLTTPEYSLWEVHGNGNERKLDKNEKPLLVQLNWHKDDKDGKFILKSNIEPQKINRNAERFSRRFRSKLKKRSKSTDTEKGMAKESKTITEEIFDDVSNNPFNRTISNPEIVMKKQREQKLENKLKEFMSGNGGSLKIYGYNINSFKKYVSILASTYDNTLKILTEALQKYNLGNEDLSNFVLTQKVVPEKLVNELSKSTPDVMKENSEDLEGFGERILNNEEYPLLNLLNYKKNQINGGTSNDEIIFTLRRRSSITSKNVNEKPSINHTTPQYQHHIEVSKVSSNVSSPTTKFSGTRPIIVPINNLTGRENHDDCILIQPNVTIIGSSQELIQPQNQGILLNGQGITSRHCLISFSDNNVSITPLNERNLVEVNGQKIASTTVLRDGFIIKIGSVNKYRFYSNSIINQNISVKKCFDPNPYATPIITRRKPSYHFPSSHLYGNLQNSLIYPPQNLPGLIEVNCQYGNDNLFLSLLISNSTIQLINSPAAPIFILYMSLRHRSCTLYKPYIQMDIRNEYLQQYFDMICKKMTHIIYSTSSNIDSLSFWLTVSSELLFIIQSDVYLHSILSQLGDNLFNLVEKCFSFLNDVCHVRLSHTMNIFLNETINDIEASNETIFVFDNILNQLHKNCINANLQIQIFSQLFHYVNMYIFNWMVGTEEGSRHIKFSWAIRLKERLYNIYKWAESHGLELAFECHMDRIQQAVNLLITPKTADQISVLGATCYKLNSRQIEYLLTRYINDVSEVPITESIINDCIKLSQSLADESAKEEGLSIELLEEKRLNIPFTFPQEGYVIERQKGIPPYLMELIDYIEGQGLCRFIPLSNINGSWTVHMKHHIYNFDTFSQASTESASSKYYFNTLYNQGLINNISVKPQIISISFTKINNGIGLSIVAAQSKDDTNIGIYVKQVIEGGAAHKDGRIEPGDQLLLLNGHSLIGISQEVAANIMIQCGPQLYFEVAKGAAYYNGLSTLFFKSNNHNASTIDRNISRHESLLQNNSYKCNTNRPLVIQPGRPSRCTPSNINKSMQECQVQYNSNNQVYSTLNQDMISSSTIDLKLKKIDLTSYSLSKSSIPIASIPPNNLQVRRIYQSSDKELRLGESYERIKSEITKIKDEDVDRNVSVIYEDINITLQDSDKHSISSVLSLSGVASKIEQKQQSETFLKNVSTNEHVDIENVVDNLEANIEKINLSIDKNEHKENSFNNHQLEELSIQSENRNPLQDDVVEDIIDDFKLIEQENIDEDEPRVQIIGNNEVYNDTKIKKLTGIQLNSNSLNVDGSNLDFKDKVKMFASSFDGNVKSMNDSTNSIQNENDK